MDVFILILHLIGGMGMFLFGMKAMSDGIQKSAGDRMRKTLNFMTGNRVAGVLTGFSVTGIIQSSHAVTFMVISFVNAGLLTLKQAIGVIMGSNVGTTVTAWIVSLVGFKLDIQVMAWPAIGVGFVLSMMKWKHKGLGEFLLGFGFLFLGLSFLTEWMTGPKYKDVIESSVAGITILKDTGFTGILVGSGVSVIITMLLHSSSASIAIILMMAFSNIISFEVGAGFVLGANIGSTIDAALASIGSKTAAKRAAMVHVFFNIIGSLWAFPLVFQLIKIVAFISPGNPRIPEAMNPFIMTHLAMFHTIFNGINTIIFLPFVNQFARLVTFLVKEKEIKESSRYKFTDYSPAAPELSIVRVEKEIRDMAGIVSLMYTSFSDLLRRLNENDNREKAAEKLCEDLKQQEEYIDEMRDTLTSVLIEFTREQLNTRTGQRLNRLMRVIRIIEEMSDECYSISKLLEKSIRKDYIFDGKSLEELVPYVDLLGEFLNFFKNQLGQGPVAELAVQAIEYEDNINKSRKKLQKLGRKRIEAGGNVKKELLFIDLVNRIEKLGDYCMSITLTITN